MKRFLLGLPLLLVLSAVVLYVYSRIERTDGGEDVYACTMDALICPDGSAVGRTGPDCAFSPCAPIASFTGELRVQGDEYHVVVEAPQSMPSTATYALPLEMGAGEAFTELVGKQVLVHGSFSEGNTYMVETIERAPDAGEHGTASQGTVPIGATAFVGGIRITLHEIVGDYRCPVDVECIQAGAITARVTFVSDTDNETFNMPSDEAPRPFDSYQVSIVDVTPPLLSTEEADPSAYEVTFRVEPLAEPL